MGPVIKSPEEKAITKQSCRDESVVFFLFSICTTLYFNVSSTVGRRNQNIDSR